MYAKFIVAINNNYVKILHQSVLKYSGCFGLAISLIARVEIGI